MIDKPYAGDGSRFELLKEKNFFQKSIELCYMLNKETLDKSKSKVDEAIQFIDAMEDEEMKKSLKKIANNNSTFPEYLREESVYAMLLNAQKILAGVEVGYFHSDVYIDVLVKLKCAGNTLYDMLQNQYHIGEGDLGTKSPFFALETIVNEAFGVLRRNIDANRFEKLVVLDEDGFAKDIEFINNIKARVNQRFEENVEVQRNEIGSVLSE